VDLQKPVVPLVFFEGPVSELLVPVQFFDVFLPARLGGVLGDGLFSELFAESGSHQLGFLLAACRQAHFGLLFHQGRVHEV